MSTFYTQNLTDEQITHQYEETEPKTFKDIRLRQEAYFAKRNKESAIKENDIDIDIVYMKAGEHDVKIVEARTDISGATQKHPQGCPQVVIQFTNKIGETHFERYYITNNALWKIRNFMEYMKIPIDVIDAFAIDKDPQQTSIRLVQRLNELGIIGKKAHIKLGHNKNFANDIPEIRFITPINNNYNDNYNDNAQQKVADTTNNDQWQYNHALDTNTTDSIYNYF